MDVKNRIKFLKSVDSNSMKRINVQSVTQETYDGVLFQSWYKILGFQIFSIFSNVISINATDYICRSI